MNGTPWADYERDFLRETYPDRTWRVSDIARKLERTPKAVRQEASDMGLNRKGGGRPRKLDYKLIEQLASRGWTQQAITHYIGCGNGAVSYALRAMRGDV